MDVYSGVDQSAYRESNPQTGSCMHVAPEAYLQIYLPVALNSPGRSVQIHSFLTAGHLGVLGLVEIMNYSTPPGAWLALT